MDSRTCSARFCQSAATRRSRRFVPAAAGRRATGPGFRWDSPPAGCRRGELVSIQVKWAGLKSRPDCRIHADAVGCARGSAARRWKPAPARSVRPPQAVSRNAACRLRPRIRSPQATQEPQGRIGGVAVAGVVPVDHVGQGAVLFERGELWTMASCGGMVMPAAIMPRAKIRVSRPQSRNQG